MTYAVHSQQGWPTESQKLLLRTILNDGDAAVDAWRKWNEMHDIGSFDRGSAGILNILYLQIKQRGIDVDDSTLFMLKGLYQQTRIRNLISKHVLLKISCLLDEAGIKFMVPKGIPLTLFYYPDPGARHMRDIDLLIQPKDLTATATLLQEHEWTPRPPLPPAGLVQYFHAAHFYHPRQGCLDLHWVPFGIESPTRATTAFWQRAICRQVEGSLIRVPDVTDLFLQVCFQSRKLDSQAKCRWIIDALTLIGLPDNALDWDVLAKRSKEADIMLPVCDSLSYLHQEFGPIVPEDVLEQFQNSTFSRTNRTTYFELGREGEAKRGVAELILSRWRRYGGVRRSRSEPASLLGFAGYCVEFLNWYWQTPSLKQLPGMAAKRLLRRLRPSKQRIRNTA
jgi:hypothetical protein